MVNMLFAVAVIDSFFIGYADRQIAAEVFVPLPFEAGRPAVVISHGFGSWDDPEMHARWHAYGLGVGSLGYVCVYPERHLGHAAEDFDGIIRGLREGTLAVERVGIIGASLGAYAAVEYLTSPYACVNGFVDLYGVSAVVDVGISCLTQVGANDQISNAWAFAVVNAAHGVLYEYPSAEHGFFFTLDENSQSAIRTQVKFWNDTLGRSGSLRGGLHESCAQLR